MLRMLLVTGSVLLAGCAAAPSSAPTPTAAPTKSPPPSHAHTFVFLRTGEHRADFEGEKLSELMNGHMANIGRLANEHSLYVAGPFGKPTPEPDLRGLFIFASSDVAEVERLILTDPSIAAGVLAGEVVPFTTDKDLADVHRRGLEFEARRKADPSIEMMSGMSSYITIFADDAERAFPALASLRAERLIVLEGRFGGSRTGQAFFVLDTPDATTGGAMLEPVRETLGGFHMIPWWASVELKK